MQYISHIKISNRSGKLIQNKSSLDWKMERECYRSSEIFDWAYQRSSRPCHGHCDTATRHHHSPLLVFYIPQSVPAIIIINIMYTANISNSIKKIKLLVIIDATSACSDVGTIHVIISHWPGSGHNMPGWHVSFGVTSGLVPAQHSVWCCSPGSTPHQQLFVEFLEKFRSPCWWEQSNGPLNELSQLIHQNWGAWNLFLFFYFIFGFVFGGPRECRRVKGFTSTFQCAASANFWMFSQK